MTVARVEGVCNGATIIFTPNADGTWDVDVPALPSDTYVVSVTAYDEAGNSAYRALMLFSVDVQSLVVKILPLHFASAEVPGQYGAVQQRTDFAYAVMDEPYQYHVLPGHFKAVMAS